MRKREILGVSTLGYWLDHDVLHEPPEACLSEGSPGTAPYGNFRASVVVSKTAYLSLRSKNGDEVGIGLKIGDGSFHA